MISGHLVQISGYSVEMSEATCNALPHVINDLESGSWQFFPLPAK